MTEKPDIIPQRTNANRHTERGMRLLEKSIAEDGWIGAVTVAANGETFDGSARVETTAANGMLEDAIVVQTDGSRPVVVVRSDIPTADDPRAKRLGVGANQIAAENLSWDSSVLASLVTEIDLTALFQPDELAAIFADVETPEEGAGGDEFDPTPEDGPTRTSVGDLWIIGGVHRLIVGDCTDPAVVERLMGGERAALCVTDPPYAVDYDPQWRVGLGGGGTQDYANGDKIANDTSLAWLVDWRSIPADVLYVWFEARAASLLQVHLEQLGYVYLYEIIWNKDRAIFGRGDYHWKHEKCLYLAKEGKPHNYQGDRTQSTVWDIPVIQSFAVSRNPDDWGLQGHGNQKPMECMQRPIENNTARGQLVYDPFLGSGTTLIAAHRTRRRCHGCEIAPKYADVILRRAEAEGLTVERAADG
jgi:DNA modification methylase